MAKKQKVWEKDGWVLWRRLETGKTPRVVFTLGSPGGKKSGWRLYNSRTSPHRVETRFENVD